MHTHVGHTTRVCFTILIRAVTAYLPAFATRTLVTSLVLSKLDYPNSALVGLSKTLTRRQGFQAYDVKAQLWPHHPHPQWTPLAEDRTQDWIQSGTSGLQVPQRIGSLVSWVKNPMPAWHADSKTTQIFFFVAPLQTGRATQRRRGQIVYGCWPKDLESTSTRGHICSYYWRLQKDSEDAPVRWPWGPLMDLRQPKDCLTFIHSFIYSKRIHKQYAHHYLISQSSYGQSIKHVFFENKPSFVNFARGVWLNSC